MVSMPFRIKVSLAILLALVGLVVLGPLVIPVRPLDGLVSAEELADDDSRFTTVLDTQLHYKTSGRPEGDGPVFVLLHGFGSSLYTWHEVLPALGDRGYAAAFDLPGFGLTERPRRGTWSRGANPYSPDTQVDLTIGFMDSLGIDSAVLVGNSSGATLATEVALAHPERVDGLVLLDAAILRGGGPPTWSRPLLHTPQMNRIGPLLMRSLGAEPGENLLRASWSDPERVDDETLDAYREYTRVEGWDAALWEVAKASRRPTVGERLDDLVMPALVVTGADDAVVPPSDAEQIAGDILESDLVELPSCGHTPQEECPRALLDRLEIWLDLHLPHLYLPHQRPEAGFVFDQQLGAAASRAARPAPGGVSMTPSRVLH